MIYLFDFLYQQHNDIKIEKNQESLHSIMSISWELLPYKNAIYILVVHAPLLHNRVLSFYIERDKSSMSLSIH